MSAERLYYTDCYLREFEAEVQAVSADGVRVQLDRSAFYPTSGGQPHDLGTLGGQAVVEVLEEDGDIVHVLAAPLGEGAARVAGVIDWPRRHDLMQQHTGQHLLSAVLEQMFGMKTVSVHMGLEASTIELDAGKVEDEQLRQAEMQANMAIAENLAVTIGFEYAGEAEGLRKASAREGTLRIVSIEGLDRSACGGTHVRATGEIGALLIRRTERIRGQTRIEFLAGARAIARARADYELLTQLGRLYSAPLEELPGLAAASKDSAKDSAKQLKQLQLEIAGLQGLQFHAAAALGADGVRRHYLRAAGPLDDAVRAVAQAFVSHGGAAFLATHGGAVLYAASADSGLHAGNQLKDLLTAMGGRGGGAAGMAQGTVGDAEQAAEIAARLGF